MQFFRKSRPTPSRLFISIGAGLNQIPLITEAKKLGFRTVGVDRDACAPGISKCDICVQESIDNYVEIYKKIQELLPYGDISGVLSRSYGAAVKSACFIAGKFGIPMMPFQRMDDFISKKRMKAVFTRNGLPTPQHVIIEAPVMQKRLAKLKYPLVVKPVAGHAKTDVKLIRSGAELQRFFSGGASGKGSFIAESYIAGDEIIAAGIVYMQRYHLVMLSDKEVTPKPYFVDLVHSTPSKHENLRGRIAEIGQGVAEAFEITTAPLIMELFITADGEIYIIEAVPEFGGEYIPDILVPESTGYNFFREMIRAASGTGFNPPVLKKHRRNSVMVRYITSGKGKLVSFNEGGPKKIAGIVYSRMLKSAGSELREPSNNHDRLGVVIAKGATRDAAASLAGKAIKSLEIIIQQRGHHDEL